MKKTLFAVLVFSLVAVNAFAAKFTVDNAHSNVDFTIRHLASNVRGHFDTFEGSFDFDDAKGDKLENVKMTVDANSINTANKKRDDHLRSPDFFDVAKYPKLSFVGKKSKKTGGKKFKLEGDLTIHGVTKPATFDVEYIGTSPNMMGGTSAGFTATSKINRKDYGIVWNKTLDKGSMVLGDDVTIQLNIEAVKETGQDAAKEAAKAEKKESK